MKTPLILLALVSSISSSFAATVISLNFVGTAGAGGTLASSDQAGLPNAQSPVSGVNTFVGNWNNVADNNSSGSASALITDSGASSAAGVSWLTDLGGWQLPDTTSGANTTANRTMMKGYLDVQSSATISLSGLSGDFVNPYTVIVYFDGDNGGSWRVGNFTINGTTLGGEDSEGVGFNAGGGGAGNENPDGLFQLPVGGGTGNAMWPVVGGNNSEGNYVVFTGVTGSSFTLTAGGGATADALRAPINGIQIIGVPEPSLSVLSGFAIFGMLLRRKRQ
jgi:hypothetical protein